MNVSFEVLGTHTSTRSEGEPQQSRRELQCSLMVSHGVLESRPFDAARLNLVGQLKSIVNGTKSNKPFVTLSKSLHWSDFYPMTPCTQTFKSRQQADVTFNLGPTSWTNRANLLPFSSVSIASETTCDHALSNRRHIKAQSRVQYMYEVIFYNKSEQIQIVRGPVSIEQPATVHLRPARSDEQLSHPLKAPQSSLRRLKSMRQSSNDSYTLKFSLNHEVGETVYDKPPTIDSSIISIPFSLDLSSSKEVPAQLSHLIRYGACCDVTTKWYIHRTVGAPGQNVSRTNMDGVSKASVITAKTRATVPPLYQASPAHRAGTRGQYSATSSIELELPRSALIPTTDIDGLKINYGLELHIALSAGATQPPDGQDGTSSIAETSFRLPVNVIAG